MSAAAIVDGDQRDAFAREGYILVPGVVKRPAIDAALQVANHWLDDEFDSTRRAVYHSQSFAPQHQRDPEIVGLLTDTDAFSIAESLVGGRLVEPRAGQITLRFPEAAGAEPHHLAAHLDGIPTPLNGVAADGEIHNFTILAAVFLSDCPPGDHGNFTVWPGTHLETARWLRDHGTTVDDPGSFLSAMHALADATSKPTPLEARAGDLVLAHYLLLHSSGRHRGPNIRYTVFFRLVTPHHPDVARASLTNPWLDWPTFNTDT